MREIERLAKEQVIQAVVEAHEPYPPPARFTEEQIRELAVAILHGKLIHGLMIESGTLLLVFLPLALLDFSRMPEAAWRFYVPCGVIGRDHTAGSINGWPIFTEFRWVHTHDLEAAVYAAEAMHKALAAVEIPTPSA